MPHQSRRRYSHCSAHCSGVQVIFNGNGYDPAWPAEATARGLFVIPSNVEAMCCLSAPKNIAMFEAMKVHRLPHTHTSAPGVVCRGNALRASGRAWPPHRPRDDGLAHPSSLLPPWVWQVSLASLRGVAWSHRCTRRRSAARACG
jgi:hypothetical protein